MCDRNKISNTIDYKESSFNDKMKASLVKVVSELATIILQHKETPVAPASFLSYFGDSLISEFSTQAKRLEEPDTRTIHDTPGNDSPTQNLFGVYANVLEEAIRLYIIEAPSDKHAKVLFSRKYPTLRVSQIIKVSEWIKGE